MAITLARQTLEHADAVRAFNARLVARDAVPGFLLQETPPAARGPEAPIVKRTFLALEDSAVRGGFELHSQRFWVAGELRQASHYRAPISEGIADRRYAFLGMLMVREALRAESFLFCVGMGGVE